MIIEKAREFQKTSISPLLTMPKSLKMWIREHKPQDALKIAFAVLYKCNHMYMVLEKAEEPEIKLPTSAGSWKKQESSRKTFISALLNTPNPLTVWITINCGKF